VCALLLAVFICTNILLGAGRNKFQCTDNVRFGCKRLTETKFHTQTKQSGKMFKLFLWGRMDMTAKLRKILKLSTFSNLKWGKPSNWGTLNGSSTVYCMFGNSNWGSSDMMLITAKIWAISFVLIHFHEVLRGRDTIYLLKNFKKKVKLSF
jgi:hypothetical protein